MKTPGQLTQCEQLLVKATAVVLQHLRIRSSRKDSQKLLNHLLVKQMDGAQHIPPACPDLRWNEFNFRRQEPAALA